MPPKCLMGQLADQGNPQTPHTSMLALYSTGWPFHQLAMFDTPHMSSLSVSTVFPYSLARLATCTDIMLQFAIALGTHGLLLHQLTLNVASQAAAGSLPMLLSMALRRLS